MQQLSTNSPGFAAANHVVTLMRVTNQRVVYLSRLVAGQQFRSNQLCYCAVNKRLRVPVYYMYISNYTVSQKKQDTKLLPITLPNIGRFSKFFHC